MSEAYYSLKDELKQTWLRSHDGDLGGQSDRDLTGVVSMSQNYISLCGEIYEIGMREFMSVVRALGDENRLRVLLALRSGELCLYQLIEFLRLAPSTVSKHMSILKQVRLVDSRKSWRLVCYRLAGNDSAPMVQAATTWVCRSLAEDPSILRDDEPLQEVLTWDLRTFCCAVNRKAG